MEKRRRGSIRTRLIYIPLIVVLIGIAGITGISSYLMKKGLMEEMEQNGISTSKQLIERFDENAKSLETINNILEEKIKTAAKTVGLNPEKLDSKFLKQLATASEIEEINCIDSKGEVIYSNIDDYVGMIIPEENTVMYELMDSSDTEAMEDIRKDGFADRYLKYGYAKDGEFIIQVGVLADEIQALTDALSYQALVEEIATDGEIFYTIFIDKNMKAIASSLENALGMEFDDEGVRTAAVDGEYHIQESFYDTENMDIYNINYPVIVNDEHIGGLSIGYSLERVHSTIKTNVTFIIITGLFIFILLGLVLYIASNYAIVIVRKLKEQMGFMAEGDFTNNVPEEMISKNDEFGLISDAVATMQDSVKSVLRNVVGSAEQLAASSEELTATSQQSALSADEVAKVIEDIAEGASNQAKETEHGASSISTLGDLVIQNKDNMESLNEATGKVTALKDEGLEILKELVEKTSINMESSKEVQNIIINTNASARKIEEASKMIQGIADQTNLLALNAAIEAARAGEAGSGFAVVADEIRKLAEQSSEFTGDINNIIMDLTDKTSTAVKTMEELEGVVLSQSESVERTNTRFDGIAEAIEETKRIIEIVSDSSDEMAKRKDEMINIIEQLSAISEENAAGTQEAAASVEEQTASTEEIANSSEDLAKIAEHLNEEVTKFKI